MTPGGGAGPAVGREDGAWPVAAVRAAEEALMARLPEGALMQRAVAGLARRCAGLLRDGRGGVYGAQVVLLVGSGNNGGDALYAGAALARRGARVDAITVRAGHPGGLAALRGAGGRVHVAGSGESPELIAGADLVVDGLIGIGGRGGLRPDAAALAEATEAARIGGATVVAVDVPSGVDSDTGAVLGEAITADVTVTFGCFKPGLLVGAGAPRAGLVELVDIGLGPYLTGEPLLTVTTLDEVSSRWPRPGPTDDKYTRGVLGIAAGSAAYPGSAVLAVGGALAGPAGYIRYVGAAADAVRAHHPEVVCTERLADTGRVQAWVVGSGLGTDAAAEDVVRTVLGTDLPVLLDADAITIVAAHPEWLRDRGAPTLLTPHDREFARIAWPVGDDRVAAARSAARRFQATFLLKGDRTIVASPDGRVAVDTAGTAVLATAGSGDVLSGIVGSLLAGAVPTHAAGAYGAFVHGLAGRDAAGAGPVSAGRLPDALRRVVRTVLAGT